MATTSEPVHIGNWEVGRSYMCGHRVAQGHGTHLVQSDKHSLRESAGTFRITIPEKSVMKCIHDGNADYAPEYIRIR